MDDFLSKKRDSGPILDLSRATANSKEEFRKLWDKVPDFKMKPEKVRVEDIKVKDNVKKMKFKTSKKDYKAMKEVFQFSDPVPTEMRGLKVTELAAVPIDWKMLTSIRPKIKTDELYYSRLIELKKLEQKTEAKEKRDLALNPQIRKIKNKAGVIEFRIKNCPECLEDFCSGKACKLIAYESFLRIPETTNEPTTKLISLELIDNKKKKKKSKGKHKERKSRSPSKRRVSKKTHKSKSPKKK